MCQYPPKRAAQRGFSLVEVLLIIALLSATILPFTLLLTQTSVLSKNVYVQSTRNLFFSSANDQMDPTRVNYYDSFNNTTMTTTMTESGQTLPFMTVVDTTNSNAFNKVASLYAYNSTSDALSAPKSNVALFNSSDVIRMRCGSSTSLIDSSGFAWGGDQAYDGTKKQPGYYLAGTTGFSVTTITNTTGTDSQIFQAWREGATSLDYRFDVPNGDYTVFLYFAEMNSATNRAIDITLEGVLQTATTPYNAYGNTAANATANIANYDITVSDGVLNINLDKDASAGSGVNPRISGIVVKKRQIEP